MISLVSSLSFEKMKELRESDALIKAKTIIVYHKRYQWFRIYLNNYKPALEEIIINE